MKCPRCNGELGGYQRFCPLCGFYVEHLAGESEPEVEPELEYEPEFAEEPEPDWEPEPEPEVAEYVEPEPQPETVPESEPEQPTYRQQAAVVATTPSAPVRADSRGGEPTFYDDYDYYDDYEYALDNTGPTAIEIESEVILLDDDNDPYVRAAAYEHRGLRGLKKRWRTIALVAACTGALTIAGVTSLRWNENQQKVEAEAAAAAEAELRSVVEVTVGLDVPMYDEVHMTNAPLHVVGSTSKGVAVDQLFVLHPTRDILTLERGTYIVSSGGPILSDLGELYDGTVDSFALSIDDDNSTVNGRPVNLYAGAAFTFVYRQVEPQNVTDSELDAARAWMLEAEIVNYQAYTDAVIQKRQEAYDRLAEERQKREEEERKAAEEAANQAEEQKKKEEEEKQNNTVTNPDGSITTTTHGSDGSTTTITTNPDGSSTTKVQYADGTSKTTKRDADGTTTTTDVDGSVTVTYADGTTSASTGTTGTDAYGYGTSTGTGYGYDSYGYNSYDYGYGYDTSYGTGYGTGYDSGYGYDTGYGYGYGYGETY